MITKQLSDFWNANPTVRHYVKGRLFLAAAHQDQPLPYIILRVISHQSLYTLTNEDGCRFAVVEVDIYADTVTEAHDIAESIRMATSGYYGPAGDGYINGCTLESDNEQRVMRRDGKGFFFNKSVDYRINFTQPVPNHGAR